MSEKISNLVQTASNSTQFHTSYFLVYDRSTTDTCDRLILIEPFSWIVLAKNKKVYVVSDMSFDCPIGSFSATKIHKNDKMFEYVCMNGSVVNLIERYKNQNNQIFKIPFDIEKLQVTTTRFTILDALNYLFKTYITIEEDTLVVFSKKLNILMSESHRSKRDLGVAKPLISSDDPAVKGAFEFSLLYNEAKMRYFKRNPIEGVSDYLRTVDSKEADAIYKDMYEESQRKQNEKKENEKKISQIKSKNR